MIFRWLLYDAELYNAGNPAGTSFNGWGENYCIDFTGSFAGIASSARFTGPPDGYKYSTLNFYQYDNYGGEEQYFYGDSATVNKDDFGNSAIISGCEPWTVYE